MAIFNHIVRFLASAQVNIKKLGNEISYNPKSEHKDNTSFCVFLKKNLDFSGVQKSPDLQKKKFQQIIIQVSQAQKLKELKKLSLPSVVRSYSQ